MNANVNQKVFLFNRTIINMLSDSIPYETLKTNDKDPTWFTTYTK